MISLTNFQHPDLVEVQRPGPTVMSEGLTIAADSVRGKKRSGWEHEAPQGGTLSFREYINLVHPRYKWYKHCEKIVDILQRVADGKLKRVMIFAPPRHGKSETVSRLFSSYFLYRYPHRWVSINSYGANLAFTLSDAARNFYKAAGGLCKPGSDAKDHWETCSGGGFFAAGVGGGITGKGWHLGLIDDSLKNAEEAMSPVIREKQKEWYRSTFYTREEPWSEADPDGALVFIMTRWNEDDLAGWQLSEEVSEDEDDREHWHIVSMEAIKEEIPESFPPTCTVEPDWRQPGEPLCPERRPLEKLLRLKKKLGSYYWTALYQQRPRPIDGEIIKTEYFDDRYDHDNPPKFDSIIVSCDTADKPGIDNAYSCFTAWGVTRSHSYLIDVYRRKVDQPTLKNDFYDFCIKHRPSVVLIEDKASGIGLIQYGQKESRLNIIPVKPDKDKITRLINESPAFEARNVMVPRSGQTTWLYDYLEELTTAPYGKYMDQCDSTSQLLQYVRLEWQPRSGAAMLRGKKHD